MLCHKRGTSRSAAALAPAEDTYSFVQSLGQEQDNPAQFLCRDMMEVLGFLGASLASGGGTLSRV